VLGIEPNTSCLLGKHFAVGLSLQPPCMK
jgi:hypothetical protein